MVVALELKDLRTAGHSAGQADGGHHGFGSGIRETDHFRVPDHLLQHFGHFDFNFGGGRKVRAAGGGLCNCLCDVGVGMAQRQRAKAHHPIDVLVAIDVEQARAFPPRHEQRACAVVHGPARGRTAALDQYRRTALVQVLRLCRGK